VPILDRIQKKLKPVVAARRTVELTIKRPIGQPRRLESLEAILRTMADGSPVVLMANLPRVAFERRVPRPGVAVDPRGYFVLNGSPRTRNVVTLVYHNPKLHAVRFTPALGRGWGEGGRAWLRTDDLRALLNNGAKAWAPEKGPIP